MKTYDVKIEGRTYRVEVEEVTGTGAAAESVCGMKAATAGAGSVAGASVSGSTVVSGSTAGGGKMAAGTAAVSSAGAAGAESVTGAAVSSAGGAREDIEAPMPGTILRVCARDGQEVKAGDVILVLEAMKMENEITASRSGKLTGLAVVEGQQVAAGQLLAAVC